MIDLHQIPLLQQFKSALKNKTSFTFCLLLVLIGPFVFSNCNHRDKNTKTTKNNDQTADKTKKIESQILKISSSVFKTNNGWGYDIIINNKIVIHQAIIPAINCSKSFSTAEKANKTANYVVDKIKAKHKFPSLTIKELDSLKVLSYPFSKTN